jgi:arylsulfatase A-like enzyme
MVDAAFLSVLVTLDRLGISDNTIVIYTADHGDAIGSHGGVFDKDSVMLEETGRVPMCIRWPAEVPQGLSAEQPVSNMDLVPTVLEAAGAEMPEPVDGRSLLGLALDPGRPMSEEDLMTTHHGHGSPCFQRMLRRGKHKYVAHLDDLDELYDLSTDPYEMTNLVAEPRMDAVLQQARDRLLFLMDNYDDDEPDARTLRDQMC